jgi:hypothetical protein
LETRKDFCLLLLPFGVCVGVVDGVVDGVLQVYNIGHIMIFRGLSFFRENSYFLFL